MTSPIDGSAPKRIGVLTFHRCINYGSYWQARCLVEGLRSIGYDAVLLDHRSSAVNRAEWRCALAPVPGERDARSAYTRKARSFFDAFDDLPQSAPFPLDRPAEAGSFDVLLVGSDEVWNLLHPWYGGCDLFYGRGFDARLASYAASFGNQNAGSRLPNHYADLLRRFSAIAVRDQNSQRIVSDAIDAKPELVLDPCMQFEGQIVGAGQPDLGVYVAVYGHSFPLWFSRTVRTWADAKGLTLVSIGYRNDWAHRQWIEAGPLDFPAFIAGAQAIATNFFHGCVFSLVNAKPFVCAPSGYRNNKVRDLLDMVRAPERLLAEADQPEVFSDLIVRPPGAGTIEQIQTLRAASGQYLHRALQ